MQVEHDAAHHRFKLDVGGEVAELVYRPDGSTLDLVHTRVPDDAAGHGLGGQLAQAAFDWARANGAKLVVTCPFVRKWLERHPDQRDLVVE